jgi:hypothetical protein
MTNTFNRGYGRKPGHRRKACEENYSKREHKAQIDKALAEYYAKYGVVETAATCIREPTIAERIAAMLGNNEHCWKTSSGVSFAALVLDHSPTATHYPYDSITRFVFRDRSAIIETPDHWAVETKTRNVHTLRKEKELSCNRV